MGYIYHTGHRSSYTPNSIDSMPISGLSVITYCQYSTPLLWDIYTIWNTGVYVLPMDAFIT